MKEGEKEDGCWDSSITLRRAQVVGQVRESFVVPWCGGSTDMETGFTSNMENRGKWLICQETDCGF